MELVTYTGREFQLYCLDRVLYCKLLKIYATEVRSITSGCSCAMTVVLDYLLKTN